MSNADKESIRDTNKLSLKDLQKWTTGLYAANPQQAKRLVQRIKELEDQLVNQIKQNSESLQVAKSH